MILGNEEFLSSNINEVVRVVLKFFLFFLQKGFARTKSTKSTKNTKITKSTKNTKNRKSTKSTESKSTKRYKLTKIKNALKNI